MVGRSKCDEKSMAIVALMYYCCYCGAILIDGVLCVLNLSLCTNNNFNPLAYVPFLNNN